MKKLLSVFLAVLTLSLSLTVFPSFAQEGRFTDVKKSDWFSDAVEYCADRGIFKGVNGDGTEFAPNNAVTRAMLVTVLARINGIDEDDFTGTVFDDVEAGAWYAPSVKWASENGIVSGVGDNLFNPDGEITREQMATMLYNYEIKYYGEPDNVDGDVILNFGDLDSLSSWSRIAVRWATGTGIVTGMGTIKGMPRLNPQSGATRAQISQLLMNYLLSHPEIAATNISSNRQLFLDDSLIDKKKTTAELSDGNLVKKESVFVFDEDYEGRDSVYHNIVYLPDGSYRMYYKATATDGHRRICYIESKDGITWTRARLIYNCYNGDATTNIVTSEAVSPDNLFVFYDTNPACPDSEKFKGIYGQFGTGLYCETSGDGRYFSFGSSQRMFISTTGTGCYFDTLNTVYWDSARGKYVAFMRGFHNENTIYPNSQYVSGATRDIRYSESEDFITWSEPLPLEYNDEYDYQMYANAITPYGRGTGLYIGLPTRYLSRSNKNASGDTLLTDTMFMFSKNLLDWTRFDRAFVTPGSENSSNWYYGDCYPCVGFIETAPESGGDPEYSFFIKERDPDSGLIVLYRYTIRIDGFRSAGGDSHGDTLVTKPLIFDGSSLELNYATSAAGKIRAVITDTDGNSVASRWYFGDRISEEFVFDDAWVSDFAGKTVTITFELYDAQLYSFKFN